MPFENARRSQLSDVGVADRIQCTGALDRASLARRPAGVVPQPLMQDVVSKGACWMTFFAMILAAIRPTAIAGLLIIGSFGGQAMAAQMLPPSIDRDPALHADLEAAYAAKGPDYEPRTHLMDEGEARYVNRLITEASPYLIQHAHNPVDWHAWTPETLAKAAALDKPIFLSVGYATCHWCHVMEEESFDNEQTAEMLNRYFIPVKIDREQMPALDHFYITATQLQQGHAGWPNSAWLLPDGRPFHTGTYFPPDDFLQIVSGIGAAYASGNRRDEIEEVASNVSEAVRRVTQMHSRQSAALDEIVMSSAVGALTEQYNALEGGFSDTQQFPQEGYLLWLLDHWRRSGDEAALGMATESLHAIAAGGIHDHAGGGFHRYAVDPNWRTPHFEKMLYNQGLLARAFVEAWEITGEATFKRAAMRTFAYLGRDMTDPGGAFYAAEDADSLNAAGEREEGAFYAWTPEALTEVTSEAAVAALGILEPPTLEAGAVIHLDPTAVANFEALDPLLEQARLAREARPRPIRDDKIIAGWNGLAIRALADGAAAFGEPRLAQQGARAGEVLWQRLWDGAGLKRLWAVGQAREAGALEDYAWLGLGFVALADATGDEKWLERARLLAAAMWETFEDGEGRLKMSARDGPLGPIYDSSDSAVPSGESSALELLARLARRGTDPETEARAAMLRGALSGPLSTQPLLRPDALSASRILDDGESGARQARARGTVRLHQTGDRLKISIAPGWHLNANEPGQDWLIGAAMSGAVVDWPAGRAAKLGISDGTINVYEGELELRLRDVEGKLVLTLQACSDSICLEPEEAIFRLP